MSFAGKNNQVFGVIKFETLRIQTAKRTVGVGGGGADGGFGLEVIGHGLSFAHHTVTVDDVNILLQAEGLFVLVIVTDGSLNIIPRAFGGGYDAFGVGEFDELGTGGGFINIVSGKVVDFVAAVGDVKVGVFHMQFFKLALLGEGDVNMNGVFGLFQMRNEYQEAKQNGG